MDEVCMLCRSSFTLSPVKLFCARNYSWYLFQCNRSNYIEAMFTLHQTGFASFQKLLQYSVNRSTCIVALQKLLRLSKWPKYSVSQVLRNA